MSSEMDKNDTKSFRAREAVGTIVLDGSQVMAMRRQLHELANVLTGVMISGGLLAQYLEGQALARYAAGVCEGCERGCTMVRELRSQLLAACGEAEAGARGGHAEAAGEPRVDEGPF
jgi:hypothetical protein